jgi:hypothetical protein
MPIASRHACSPPLAAKRHPRKPRPGAQQVSFDIDTEVAYQMTPWLGKVPAAQ